MIENHMLSPHTDTMPTRPAATIYEPDWWHDKYGMSEKMAMNMAALMIWKQVPETVRHLVNDIFDEALKIQAEE